MPDSSSPWTAPHASVRDVELGAKSEAKRFASWLFSSPKNPDSPHEVIVWWEIRRLPFNLIIGAYGAVCLVIFFAAITTSGHLQPWEDAIEPLALIAAPFVANALYTLGWIVELTYRSIEQGVSPRFGPRLFKVGLALSLFLVTVPAALWSGYRLLQWAGLAT